MKEKDVKKEVVKPKLKPSPDFKPSPIKKVVQDDSPERNNYDSYDRKPPSSKPESRNEAKKVVKRDLDKSREEENNYGFLTEVKEDD
jgi:hypothetical protein